MPTVSGAPLRSSSGPGTSAPSARRKARATMYGHIRVRAYTGRHVSAAFPPDPRRRPNGRSRVPRRAGCAASPGRPSASSPCTSPPSGRWSASLHWPGLLGWAVALLASDRRHAAGCLAVPAARRGDRHVLYRPHRRRGGAPLLPRPAAGARRADRGAGLGRHLPGRADPAAEPARAGAGTDPARHRIVARVGGRRLCHRSRPVRHGRHAPHAAQRRRMVYRPHAE